MSEWRETGGRCFPARSRRRTALRKFASLSTARKVYRLCFRISSRCATNSSRQGAPFDERHQHINAVGDTIFFSVQICTAPDNRFILFSQLAASFAPSAFYITTEVTRHRSSFAGCHLIQSAPTFHPLKKCTQCSAGGITAIPHNWTRALSLCGVALNIVQQRTAGRAY